ncbi:hypothetical protein PAPHI01_0724 [Pancytospora philotis]|nr:hypothetical protein PAPHI01_0724 [Pancytospora philotis]
MMYKCSMRVVPYVMTWDEVATKCHKKVLRELDAPMNVEAYIRSRVLRRTLESMSFEARQENLDDGYGRRPKVAAE